MYLEELGDAYDVDNGAYFTAVPYPIVNGKPVQTFRTSRQRFAYQYNQDGKRYTPGRVGEIIAYEAKGAVAV